MNLCEINFGQLTTKLRIMKKYTFIFLTLIFPLFLSAQGPGNALDFDGGNDYVNCGSIAAINNVSTLSICFWANITENSYEPLLGMSNAIINRTQVYIYLTEVYWNISNGLSSRSILFRSAYSTKAYQALSEVI